MSSTTLTDAELSSEATPASGRCWRVVEAQHYVSTAKLTDTPEEQERLEELIEEIKPPVPPECRHLNYLLSTPFRHGAPYPDGSRFRRAGMTPGVFYGSEVAETAATEMAFYRLLFYAESPDTPWPANAAQFTAFSVELAVGKSIDLTRPPFNKDRAVWTHVTDRVACQDLAERARELGISVIKYESVRDPQRRMNIAILSCRAFAQHEPGQRQTWHIQLSAAGARAICEFPKHVLHFDRAAFAADPRISEMNWER
jgi:hypothetical protein